MARAMAMLSVTLCSNLRDATVLQAPAGGRVVRLLYVAVSVKVPRNASMLVNTWTISKPIRAAEAILVHLISGV